jgi:nitroreductase/FMN reductase [NAD(P)H]
MDAEALIRARYGALPFAPAETPPALAPLLDRRVTRRYRPDPVPDALLDLVLAGAQSAPSKSDLQQYSVIVTRDAAKIASVAEAIGTMPWITGAPVFLLFCGDMRRGRRICALHGRDHANDSVDTFMNAAADAALAMGFCISAAEPPGPRHRARSPTSATTCSLREAVRLPGRRLPRGRPARSAGPGGAERPSSAACRRIRGRTRALRRTARSAGALPAYDALRPPAKPALPGGARPRARRLPPGATTRRASFSVPERANFRAWLARRTSTLADATMRQPRRGRPEARRGPRAGTRAVVPRHAASLIVWRKGGGEPEILMGMRHAKHKFMPSVLVFPGGRVDRATTA